MRQGMTLLELLLASALFIVLLGIIWSAVSFLSRVEVHRGRQTEQQRIVRTWTQMLTNDFRSAIQDTEQLNKAEGDVTIRHFGVIGTATQLQVDVSDYSRQQRDSSELRTIFYDFQQTGGLVRRERDYVALKTEEGHIQYAPEVRGGQFRYFDGNTWHDQWTSLERKNTPSAIEATFYLLSSAEWERHQVIVQIPAASPASSETYQRATPPPTQESPAAAPPSSHTSSQPVTPPQSNPFHSLFGDD